MGKVLHASGSGYFPACIAEGEPEDCPWTLENAMNTYWRVRTWTFSASGILGEDDYNFPFSSTIPNMTSRDIETGLPHTLEEGLVCGNFFEAAGGDEEKTIVFGQPQTSGGLYNSGLFGGIEDDSIPMEFVFFATSPLAQNFSISIFGINIPIIMNPLAPNTEVISGSATLTPTEWWSYGGTYDTSTGEPL
jgi:hypothetical protein